MIGLPSRYYEPYRALQNTIDVHKIFNLVYNEDKDTYSLPYLYGGYKNELEPVSISTKIVFSIKQYFDNNLFSVDERKLLLKALMPDIKVFGRDIIHRLKEKIEFINRCHNEGELSELIVEFNKTIISLEQINHILNNEIVSYFSTLTNQSSKEEEKSNITNFIGSMIINNNSGHGNIINTGNENQIKNDVILYKGDLSRLQSEFEKQGIDKEDIQEISEIIKTEQPNIEENRLGEKSNGWISKIINKSLNGIGKIATGISANILATLIKQYYGMP